MDELLTAEECLFKAQEYFALAEDASDGKLRHEYLMMAKELTELAASLGGTAGPKAA